MNWLLCGAQIKSWCLFTQLTQYFFPCIEEDHFWCQISIMLLLWEPEPPTPILLFIKNGSRFEVDYIVHFQYVHYVCHVIEDDPLRSVPKGIKEEQHSDYEQNTLRQWFFWWAPSRQPPLGESWLMGWSNQNMSFLQSSGPYRPYFSLTRPRSLMIRCHCGNKQMSQ